MIDLWRRLAAAALAFALAGACSYRPARFMDLPAVVTVRDDDPIPRPPRSEYPEWARYSDAYVRRALVGALDPRRTPDAADVNALDEVLESSWFAAQRPPLIDGYVVSDAPALPFRSFTEAPAWHREGIEVVVDAKGRRWELLADAPERKYLRTSAGAIASRLVYALGYHAAESHVVELPSGERVLAVRWPAARPPHDQSEAFDIGPTRPSGTGAYDPNDVIEHQDRRTLRSLVLVADWLGLDQIRPRLLRDVYVGAPGEGHVQHHIVGMEDALGAGTLLRALGGDDEGRPPRNAWIALGTLGFAPKQAPDVTDTPFPSVGLFPAWVDPLEHRLSVPFAPAADALIADVYWIGKRIARVPNGTIAAAVAAGRLEPPEAAVYVERALIARRDDVARFAMSFVTPLDVDQELKLSIDAAAKRFFHLSMTDLAIVHGFASADGSRYVVELLDGDGAQAAPPFEVQPDNEQVSIRVPFAALSGLDYLVVRVRGMRGKLAAPRAVEVHLRRAGNELRIRGVRH